MSKILEKTDLEIVKMIPSDKEAFGILIKKYEGPLDRYVRRLGISILEDREDVLQNTFLKVYKNINSFDSSFLFSSWIYRIAHNEAISFFRSKKVRPEGNSIDDSEDLISVLSDGTDLVFESEIKINSGHIMKALTNLDQKYKDVVILRYFEERDYTEISDILQIPLGSVATLLHRSKEQLKKSLKHIK